jgi:hypothetical protein
MDYTRIEIYEHGQKFWFPCGHGTTGIPDKLGNLLQVVEGARECALYTFQGSWDKEKPIDREYLLLMNPGLQERIESGDVVGIEIPNLYRAANKKLDRMGYTHTCTRCGGTGHHSFNMRDGTICWGCHGSGKVLDKITKKLLKELRAKLGESSPLTP